MILGQNWPDFGQKSNLKKRTKIGQKRKIPSVYSLLGKNARFAHLFFSQANVFLTRQVAGSRGKIHLLGLKKSRAQRGVFLCQENAWCGQVPIGTGLRSIWTFFRGVCEHHGIWPVLIYVKLDYIWGLTDHTRCLGRRSFARYRLLKWGTSEILDEK